MNILIIKPSSFGDIIQSNPALVALRTVFHDSRISWLTFDRWAGVVSLFPDVDDVIVWKRAGGIMAYARLLRDIRRRRFDVVIDLQGLLRSAIIARWAGAPLVRGVPGMKEGSWLLAKEVSPAWRAFNAVWRSLETVRSVALARRVDMPPFGHDTDPAVLFNLRVPVETVAETAAILARKGVPPDALMIGVVAGARGKGKQWPAERYAELIDRLVAGHPAVVVLLIGSEPSKVPCALSPRVIDTSGAFTIPQLAAALQRCRVVVGGDTGPVHLAAALGVRVSVLFGGSDVNETAPVSPLATVLKKKYDCSPCRGRPSCADQPCLTDITVDEVLATIEPWIR